MKKTKRVRFDFYDARRAISPAFDKKAQTIADKVLKYQNPTKWYQRQRLEKYTQQLNDIQQQQRTARTGVWDIAALVRYACRDDVQITHRVYGGDLLEIDKMTYYDHEDDLVAFQVTTLRSHDIPAKKKPGQAREDVGLEDDEYLGEFTQVIYDTRFHTVAIQSTKHGASYNAIESLLNEIDRQMHPNRVEIGTFDPVLNPDVIDRINASGRYKKLTVKCSDASYDHGDMPSHFSGVRDYLNPDVKSWTMELSIGISGTEPNQTLSRENVRQVVQSFQQIQANPMLDPRIKKEYEVDVTYFDEHADKYVTIDLLVPKLHFFVDVEMEARKVISSQYMYETVTEAYRANEGTLSHIMYHRLQEGG